MGEITIDCTIDGQAYSAEQLDRLRYVRELHVLHQMKRLGATIEHHGNQRRLRRDQKARTPEAPGCTANETIS
ncbi:hypothetical protein [Nonomuraea basaltis]|uniref:hypothetical protein n=1 Tax=Nonomuraea basaltis TaxID=2495887 RepID=UPI00110C6505|nr:hypothetical protein [Nonomuraea basaltis]TMR99224.1 hypothetical protein EJK15_08795 [Nonomuraea basaltis]